jgi:hypothetical protein
LDVDPTVRCLCRQVQHQLGHQIDFQGQRSRSQGLIFRRGDMPHFALPLLFTILADITDLCRHLLLFTILADITDLCRHLLFLRTMYVPSLVKIHWRMLILECSQGCYAVKIWSSDIDLWPMILKINRVSDSLTKLGTYLDLKRIWNPIDFQGQRSRSQGLIFRRGDMPCFALPCCLTWHAQHVCCLKLTSISYSFWNKGQKALKFWTFDEKRAITPKWVLRFT